MELIPFQPYKHYRDSGVLNDCDIEQKAKIQYWTDYGYTLICQEQLKELSYILKSKKVMDAGSGSGFIAQELKYLGHDVTAVDVAECGVNGKNEYFIKNNWCIDIVGNAVKHITNEYDAVILAWPPYKESFAHDVAKAMKHGQILLYQGEGMYGCTGSDQFHEYVEDLRYWIPIDEYSDALNRYQLNFMRNYDKWHVYQKN